MNLELEGRVFIVTGATSGLGRAAVQDLIDEGALVVASSRSSTALAELVGEFGRSIRGIIADNADADTAERLIATAYSEFSRLDGLLVSVGGPPPGDASSVGDELWLDSFRTIFLGTARLAREVAARLGPGGVIAVILSSSIRDPIPGLAISNALRPALAGFLKTLAAEVGPRAIRVVGLVPGRVETPRMLQLNAGTNPSSGRSADSIPLRRFGRPEEFGRVAAFVLSPAASYITGSFIVIDGGMVNVL